MHPIFLYQVRHRSYFLKRDLSLNSNVTRIGIQRDLDVTRGRPTSQSCAGYLTTNMEDGGCLLRLRLRQYSGRYYNIVEPRGVGIVIVMFMKEYLHIRLRGDTGNRGFRAKEKRRSSKLHAKRLNQRVGPVAITSRFCNEAHRVLGYRPSGPTLYMQFKCRNKTIH